MELTHTPCLRTVIAEHGTDIKQLYQIGFRIKLVLQISPHSRCRILRPQGNAPVPPVGKGVHFLVHHVGSLADTPLEKLRMLKNRGPDFAVAKAAAQLTDFPLHIIPIAY